jgi:AraC-like DNA-binding protein
MSKANVTAASGGGGQRVPDSIATDADSSAVYPVVRVHDSRATVAAPVVRSFLRSAWAIPPAEVSSILARFGCGRGDLDDPGARVDHDAMAELVDLAARTTGDERLGLHHAMFAGGRLVPVVDNLLSVSASAWEALQMVGPHLSLIHDGFRMRVTSEGGRTALHVGFAAGLDYPTSFIDFAITVLFIIGRGIGIGSDGIEIFFAHPRPEDPTEYHRVFRVPVHFGTGWNCIVLPTAALTKMRPGVGVRVAAELRDRAARITQGDARRFSDRVGDAIAAELRGDGASEACVAQRLAMTERTLRRRLAEEGTTFRLVLDDVRRRLALMHVREGDFDPDHVAFLLGFSDVRVLRRALRRWTGKSLRELASADDK